METLRRLAAVDDYDPTTGTFLTRDPLDGVDGTPTTEANPYHYADNDPLNKTDPLGLRPGVREREADHELFRIGPSPHLRSGSGCPRYYMAIVGAPRLCTASSILREAVHHDRFMSELERFAAFVTARLHPSPNLRTEPAALAIIDEMSEFGDVSRKYGPGFVLVTGSGSNEYFNHMVREDTAAFTRGRYIFCGARCDSPIARAFIIAHERVHVAQYKKYGAFMGSGLLDRSGEIGLSQLEREWTEANFSGTDVRCQNRYEYPAYKSNEGMEGGGMNDGMDDPHCAQTHPYWEWVWHGDQTYVL